MKSLVSQQGRLWAFVVVVLISRIAAAGNLATPDNIVANQYHAVAGGPGGDSRANALIVATDGIVDHGAGGQNNGFDTWPAQNYGSGGNGTPGTDHAFAGLEYGSAISLIEVVAQMGHQFGDGGNWGSMPNLYVLTSPYGSDPNNGQEPPDVDTAHWTLVPHSAYTVVSGSPSATDAVGPGPSTPYDFVLHTPMSVYGWALGGVNSPSNGSNFVSITELRGFVTPEPSSFVLCGLGVIGLLTIVRRRRSRGLLGNR